MAEMTRQLTQAEIDKILFNQRMGIQPTPPSIQNLQQNTSGTIAPVAPNFAQLAAGGANRVGQFLNQILPNAQQVVAANPLNLERLFPTTAQPQVTIPTGFNFAPKQTPTGEVIPGGLQSQQVNLNQLLSAIKPADVLGVSGAERAYTDVGYGRMPQPMDVAETLALGAGGMAAGRGLLKAGKGLPVGMSIQETTGLLQTAPKSDIGFYSAVEQAAMASPRKSATGQAFLNDIMKGPDVRADEIKWMGLDDYLKGKQNITKQEVQDYIANNRVNVQEVRSTIPRLPGEEMPGDKGAFLPKFGSYTLPGGENYRELLLTMPSNMSEYNKYVKTLREKYGEGGFANLPLTDIERARLDKFYAAEDIDPYKSTHFPQENILAHLRVNDRVDADGKKMLLIEEVQSDWHQAGREKGYAGQGSSYKELEQELSNVTKERSKLLQYAADLPDSKMDEFKQVNQKIKELSEKATNIDRQMVERLQLGESVPDAPFKDTWYQLALKRAIQHAAENGYDRIGLTTGSQQAARFDLSKQVDNLLYSKNPDGTYRVSAQVQGKGQMIGEAIPESKLADYVGKQVAERMSKGVGNKTEVAGDYDPVSMTSSKKYMTELSGDGLKIGGEGMKKYYDEIYPKFLDKYGKKWGSRVGETKVRTSSSGIVSPEQVQGWDLGGISPEEFVKQYNFKDGETIRYLDITPEMKAGVSKGQPLFQAAPIIGTGLLGSQQEDR